MRKAKAILLHDIKIEIGPDGCGLFLDFHEDKYEPSYPLGRWLLRAFDETVAGVGKMESDELYFSQSYSRPDFETQIVAVYAEIIPNNMLEIELHCSNEKLGKSVDWKEKITYHGGFSVSWDDEP